MDSGGEFNETVNAPHWLDHKYPSFTRPTWSENTKWDTVTVYMSMGEENTRKATGRVNAHWSAGYSITPLDITQIGFTLTVTYPTIWNHKLRSV